MDNDTILTIVICFILVFICFCAIEINRRWRNSEVYNALHPPRNVVVDQSEERSYYNLGVNDQEHEKPTTFFVDAHHSTSPFLGVDERKLG